MFNPFAKLFDRLILFLRRACMPLDAYLRIHDLTRQVHELTEQRAALLSSLVEMSALASARYTPPLFRDPTEKEREIDLAIAKRSWAAQARANGKPWKYLLTSDGLSQRKGPMMTNKGSTSQIRSYVMFGDRCFHVSTINRESSAINAPGRYNETFVWECDPITFARPNAALHQAESSSGDISEHLSICERIFTSGEFWEADDA